MSLLKPLVLQTKNAEKSLQQATTKQKNQALKILSKLLQERFDSVIKANQQDIEQAKKNGLTKPLIERLSIECALNDLTSSLKDVIDLKDPIGISIDKKTLDNGLIIQKKTIPIGTIGVIYESRPNVTLDVSALCIKSGNCCILRGGSETLKTNRVLVSIIKEALLLADLPLNAVSLIDSADRSLVLELLKMHTYVDMIIPRGGQNLHNYCRENSQIPVITGGIGVCHLFVDHTADLKKSLSVIENAKIQRPSVCNALDTVLIHKSCAQQFIPQIVEKLKHVNFKVDKRVLEIVNQQNITLADDADWDTEWLNLTLGIKIVPDIQAAIDHICKHSTSHSDGILTEDTKAAEKFLDSVDSSVVYVNASTRFTDGSQLGLGTEVAISTQKLHARGPMGLQELTSYKWIVTGNYHTRSKS